MQSCYSVWLTNDPTYCSTHTNLEISFQMVTKSSRDRLLLQINMLRNSQTHLKGLNKWITRFHFLAAIKDACCCVQISWYSLFFCIVQEDPEVYKKPHADRLNPKEHVMVIFFLDPNDTLEPNNAIDADTLKEHFLQLMFCITLGIYLMST